MRNKTSLLLAAFLIFTVLLPVLMTGAEPPVQSPRFVTERTGYIDVHNHLFGTTARGDPCSKQPPVMYCLARRYERKNIPGS